MIDVDHEQADRPLAARGAQPLRLERLVEQAPVADLGQRVGGRQARQPFSR
jgi:hypothetical protein